MKPKTLQAQYGTSTMHDVGEDMELVIKPVRKVNAAIMDIQTSLVKKDIDQICTSVRNLARTLRLQEEECDPREEYLRSQWKISPEKCIQTLKNACVDRPESEIVIRSTRSVVPLRQGTHFVDSVANERGDRKVVINRDNRKTLPMETNDEMLRTRMIVGPEDTIRISAERERLVLFSLLHAPAQTSMDFRPGNPVYARYLDGEKDTFMAGRHFAAEMLGDPSWHELKLVPNSTQLSHEHVHPHIRLIYVTQGTGKLETGRTSACSDQTFMLEPEKVVILTPGTWHRFSTGSTGLTVQPVHPVTPASGASANSHDMFFGTWKNDKEMLETIQRGAVR